MADVIGKIAEMLQSERAETRIAAAIVLGELETKEPAAVKGLIECAGAGVPEVRLAAIAALERIGSTKALPVLLESLNGPQGVAQAAVQAIASFGEAALPELKARMKDAPPWMQARVSEAVARISSGKKGVAALLDGFFEQDREAVLKSTLAFRQEIRAVDPKDRRPLFTEIMHFLDGKKAAASPEATCGALRLLGYLEDERALKPLLDYAGPKRPSAVRVEALLALRFALGTQRKAPEVAQKLLALIRDADRHVARTALDSLTNLELPGGAFSALEQLACGEHDDLALAAIARLGAAGPAAASALVQVALRAALPRAQAALAALGEREETVRALTDALLREKVEAGVLKLAGLLAPRARRIADRDGLAKLAAARLKRSVPVSDPVLALLADASPERFAAIVRDAAKAALAAKSLDRARALYAGLVRNPMATDEDKLALARLALAQSHLALFPAARQQDPALVLFCELARRGAPVAEALAADKKVGPEQRFFVGFHLSELPEGEGREVGHEILEPLAKLRNKLGKQAKNKLKLTGHEG